MAHQIKKSKMHRKDINNWLRSRCMKNTQTDYLYKPDEIKKRIALKSIFGNFDGNSNGKLELSEFLSMFVTTYVTKYYSVDLEKLDKYDIQTMERERKIYAHGKSLKKIQKFLRKKFRSYFNLITESNYLTLKKFISLAINHEAKELFKAIMYELTTLMETLKV